MDLTSLERLVSRFVEIGRYERSYSPYTVRWYDFRIRTFVKKTGVTQVHEVTTELLRSFLISGKREHGWSPDNSLGYYRTLRVFLNWCVEDGHLRENPILPIQRPRLDKKLPRRISEQDALRLLDGVARIPWQTPFERSRNVALVGTMLFTGLRANELLHLTTHDVDLHNRTVLVRHGKGAKDRFIPYDDRLDELLHAYVAERRCRNPTSNALFLSSNHDGAFTYKGLQLIVRRIRRETGIAFSAHRLRHTYASLMIEGGCDLFSLSKLMGHEQVTTTSIYLSVSVEHLRTKVARHPLEGSWRTA